MNLKIDPLLDAPGGALPAATCAHHWVIDTPAGPISRGQCKRCGEEREFRNSPDSTFYWEDDASRKSASETPMAIPATLVRSGLDD